MGKVEVHDISRVALNELIANIYNGDYAVAGKLELLDCQYVMVMMTSRFGGYNSLCMHGWSCDSETVDEFVRSVGRLYDYDLGHGSMTFGRDYEVWRVVDDACSEDNEDVTFSDFDECKDYVAGTLGNAVCYDVDAIASRAFKWDPTSQVFRLCVSEKDYWNLVEYYNFDVVLQNLRQLRAAALDHVSTFIDSLEVD